MSRRSRPLQLTIDHGPLFERGSGPSVLALAWGAIVLTVLAAALRILPLGFLVFNVGVGLGVMPWIHAVLRTGIVAGATAVVLLSRRARTPHERRATVIWGTLLLAIANGVAESLLMVLALARVQI